MSAASFEELVRAARQGIRDDANLVVGLTAPLTASLSAPLSAPLTVPRSNTEINVLNALKEYYLMVVHWPGSVNILGASVNNDIDNVPVFDTYNDYETQVVHTINTRLPLHADGFLELSPFQASKLPRIELLPGRAALGNSTFRGKICIGKVAKHVFDFPKPPSTSTLEADLLKPLAQIQAPNNITSSNYTHAKVLSPSDNSGKIGYYITHLKPAEMALARTLLSQRSTDFRIPIARALARSLRSELRESPGALGLLKLILRAFVRHIIYTQAADNLSSSAQEALEDEISGHCSLKDCLHFWHSDVLGTDDRLLFAWSLAAVAHLTATPPTTTPPSTPFNHCALYLFPMVVGTYSTHFRAAGTQRHPQQPFRTRHSPTGSTWSRRAWPRSSLFR